MKRLNWKTLKGLRELSSSDSKIPVMIIYRGEGEFERLVGLPRREDLDRDSQTFFRLSGNVDLR